MKKLKKLLLATVLVAAAIASAPKNAFAIAWCDECAASGSCIACCRCDGYSLYYCANIACP
jgi:hypothetical protein